MNITPLPINFSGAPEASQDPLGGHPVWEVVMIILITGPLSLVTIIGNLLVMVSFRVNSHLRTVSNYFLLSLAAADLILGTVSMNLYTTYIIMGRWALGNLACDVWLALDYVASNASVMNLLVISFDRFFSVTRPLTYRVKRTPRRAAIMISLAWTISFVLWAPAILFWQYVEGKRTVPKDECSIQFLSEPTITFGTAIAAFYLPVTIMIILYWRIYRETENRARELAGLLGSPSTSSHHHHQTQQQQHQQPQHLHPHRSSTKSSSSTSGDTQVEGSPLSRTRPGCFQVSPGVSRLLCEGTNVQAGKCSSSNGSWNDMDDQEEEDDDANSRSSSSEDGAKSTKGGTVHLPLIQVNAGQGQTPGNLKVSPDQGKPSSAKWPNNKKCQRTSIREKKAARTLTAILLAFILTWTPYNIMVLVSTFCQDCIPEKLWHLGYWLCYVNSTVNPMCYALCNKSFRITFKMLLMCRWDKRNWAKPQPAAPAPVKPQKHNNSAI